MIVEEEDSHASSSEQIEFDHPYATTSLDRAFDNQILPQ